MTLHTKGYTKLAESNAMDLGDLQADTTNLHREESFSDMRAASVRRFTPVDANGDPDPSRPVSYVGETTVVTQMGPLPLSFPIDATTLEEAFQQFPEGVKAALERLNERAKEMAREEASRIVVPSGMPPGGMPGGGMPGAGGGGKLII